MDQAILVCANCIKVVANMVAPKQNCNVLSIRLKIDAWHHTTMRTKWLQQLLQQKAYDSSLGDRYVARAGGACTAHDARTSGGILFVLKCSGAIGCIRHPVHGQPRQPAGAHHLLNIHTARCKPSRHPKAALQNRTHVPEVRKPSQQRQQRARQMSVIRAPSVGLCWHAIQRLQQKAKGVVVHEHQARGVAAQAGQVFDIIALQGGDCGWAVEH